MSYWKKSLAKLVVKRVRECRVLEESAKWSQRQEASLPSRWGRCRPHPSQTRTCGIPASGSSRERFARGGISVGNLGWRQWMAFQDFGEARPADDALAISPRQPLLPYPHYLT